MKELEKLPAALQGKITVICSEKMTFESMQSFIREKISISQASVRPVLRLDLDRLTSFRYAEKFLVRTELKGRLFYLS